MKKRHILNKIYKNKFRYELDIEKIIEGCANSSLNALNESHEIEISIKKDFCFLLNEIIDGLIEYKND